MSTLTNVQMSAKEINKIIVTNLAKMLYRRKQVDNLDSLVSKLNDLVSVKNIFDFEVNNNKFSVYILSSKLTSITQNSPLDEYLSNNLDYHKFVIISKASKKSVRQVINNYTNCEFFHEHELLEEIPAKNIIPEHQLLSEADKEKLLEKFKLSELSKIYSTDIMVRYYNAKVNDVFRIIRPNITSGKSIFYRVVVPGKVEQLFI